MFFTATAALLTLTTCAITKVFASPITTIQATGASNVVGLSDDLSGDSGISGAYQFSQTANIEYRYECPVGGVDSRVITVGVDFDGDWTDFTNKLNAEHTSVDNVADNGDMTYKVTGKFEHGMCLARSQFRYCGYSLSAALEATAYTDKSGATFSVPLKSGQFNQAPKVTEACTRSSDRAKGCAKAGQPVDCKVLQVTVK